MPVTVTDIPPNGGGPANDEGGPPPPPRGPGVPKTPKTRKSVTWKFTLEELEDKYTQVFDGVAMVFLLRGDPYCATVINERAPIAIASWMQVAKNNSSIRRGLERFASGGVYGQAVVSTIPLIMLPLAHHFPQFFPELLLRAFAPYPMPEDNPNGETEGIVGS